MHNGCQFALKIRTPHGCESYGEKTKYSKLRKTTGYLYKPTKFLSILIDLDMIFYG